MRLKRAASTVAAAYLGLAALGHLRERTGSLTCDCADSCWCKRPGIALFRWVFPVGHKLKKRRWRSH